MFAVISFDTDVFTRVLSAKSAEPVIKSAPFFINKSRYIPDISREDIFSGTFGIFTRGTTVVFLDLLSSTIRFAITSHNLAPSASAFLEIKLNNSLSFKAKPCAAALFSNEEPRPKIFLHCMNTGLSLFSARSKAVSIDSILSPRIEITDHPRERIRALTSKSVCAMPSMLNLLSSHNTIKLFNCMRPAKAMDSKETPSIKSPSLHKQ